MQVVILAAGKGIRMWPLTYRVPKPMLKVENKPLLAYTLDLLPKEINEIIIVIGYLGKQIRDYFGDNYHDRKITYVEQKELLGTGQALSLCQNLLKEKFLVINGDDFYQAADAKKCLAYQRCILAKEVIAEQQRNYGIFQIDENGNLLNILEVELRPGQKALINTGMMVLDKNFFKYDLVPIKGGKEYGLPQTVVKMAEDYPVKIIKTDYWLPIGYPDDLKRAEIHLRKHGVIK